MSFLFQTSCIFNFTIHVRRNGRPEIRENCQIGEKYENIAKIGTKWWSLLEINENWRQIKIKIKIKIKIEIEMF